MTCSGTGPVACGTKRNDDLVEAKVRRIIGTDTSRAMLRSAGMWPHAMYAARSREALPDDWPMKTKQLILSWPDLFRLSTS
jgi:hypothetical protein